MEKTKAIMLQIGMSPLEMKKEIDGFVVNRLQYGLLHAAYQLVEQGIASPSDIDKAVKDGLGLRWSFMGPFETIHLNAPKGVDDYCQRYVSACIQPVMRQIDNNLTWNSDTWNVIHQDMVAHSSSVDKLPERCRWRDQRLMDLAKLKQQWNAHDAEAHQDMKKDETGQ
ncbi:3-hydroxybutyryl-CoA dehydrogenase [Reticulomyxa filosa]|uniref:3-hydroxybutyryl-CoA dehydrogenase n=1 Tax=Reticulomyxa filosa TaxID=46433 RepID=X6P5Q7_RETFI|nr:3-hydroxybutyryl-CoA dehydrogenase [Reticulomyxa filosa]|eukprot:ETO32937.1 3-hydroxybutyryl-CoA dehydrogenase [Reticulomyxa filosa]